ncbi:MAG: CRISPR-associated protein (TIGR02584 family) [Psychroserpens sp.]|jgi:CRISPR-associated protein (TIGR02584 family)
MNSKKQILLALVGRSPQVITESIYAFKKQKGITIDQLKVVTTSYAKESTWQCLSANGDNGQSVMASLAKDIGIPEIVFEQNDVLVPNDVNGIAISDVQTADEMEAVAQFLLSFVKELTSDEEVCVHASLAGGRKTMTFYLSYAMSIYGRPQDSLSHVFVSFPYESSDFYYPTPYSKTIFTREGSRDAKDAEVNLASIPYVQLRPSLPIKFLEKTISFKETEQLYSTINAPLSLEIDTENKCITCSGINLKLTAANFAFYMLMIDDLFNANEGFDSPTSECPDKLLALLYLNKRFEVEGHKHSFITLEQATEYAENQFLGLKQSEVDGLKAGVSKSFFNGRKNQISVLLRRELPEVVAEHYDIDSLEKTARKGSTKLANYFGINIESRFVKFV